MQVSEAVSTNLRGEIGEISKDYFQNAGYSLTERQESGIVLS